MQVFLLVPLFVKMLLLAIQINTVGTTHARLVAKRKVPLRATHTHAYVFPYHVPAAAALG